MAGARSTLARSCRSGTRSQPPPPWSPSRPPPRSPRAPATTSTPIPFGDESEQATPTPTPQRPAATATPAPAQPAATATAAGLPPPSTAAETPARRRCPYTGVDAWPLGLGGALLLGTGLALRARIAVDRD